MKYNLRAVYLLVLLPILFTACNYPTSQYWEEQENPDVSSSSIVENSDLFVQSSGTDEEYVFSTNDSKYISDNGYTLWRIIESDKESTFNTIETTLLKTSGNIYAGYGIVFCIQDVSTDANTSVSYMYALLINCKGLYTLGQVKEGTFTSLIDWTESSFLLSGIGVKNKIKIEKNESTFDISFNGNKEVDFTATQSPILDSASYGYAVVISPNESFPGKEVKVIFSNEKESSL